jgi:predicted small lipoprotein YifL
VIDMIDRIGEMNERQASSLAGRAAPARGAVLGACALALAMVACGQKGPLYLPERAGVATKPPSSLPSAPEDGRPAAPPPPLEGASSPGLPAAAAPASH